MYKLNIFCHTKTTDLNPKRLKDRTEKGAIFERLKQHPGYDNLKDRKDYVTDHDVIWATNPLFPDKVKGDDEATPAEAFAIQFTPPVQHPFTGLPIQWKSVKITWEKRIDVQVNVRSFLGGPPEDIDYLTRGINAFMTQHARENATANGYETTAANRFFLTQGEHEVDLDNPLKALKALRGFTLSTRPGNDDWYLNLHVGASPFVIDGNVWDFIRYFREMNLSPREACNAFKNREATIGRRSGTVVSRIIKDVGTKQMRAAKTWPAFGVEVKRINQIPVEVFPSGLLPETYDSLDVDVEGFRAFRGLVSPTQTDAMLKFACKLPAHNKRHLEHDAFRMLGINTGQSRIADFDLAVEDTLLKVPARLLTPPQLRHRPSRNRNRNGANDGTVRAREASWNLATVELFVAPPLKKVVMMDLGPPFPTPDRNRGLNGLGRALHDGLDALGLGNVEVIHHVVPRVAHIRTPGEKQLQDDFKTVPGYPAPVLVLLPEAHYDVYSSVKRIADLQLGRHVICVVGTKLRNFGERGKGQQYLANVGLKFNLKGGGVNHAVEQSHLQSLLHPESPSAYAPCRTIIIGADVAHPTGSARPGCPSIAAVVGSVDDNYLHYPGLMRLQLSRQEFIGDLRDMVKERLIDWAVKHQNTLPANMLMYRDGVSESQYQAVRDGEIPQLQDAFNDAYEFLNPGRSAKSNPPKFNLTFVVVGKRHNTRFFTDNTCKENTFSSNLTEDEVNGDWKKLQE